MNTSEIGTLDRQIAQLNEYKPIPENEVKNLCDKVSLTSYLPAEPLLSLRWLLTDRAEKCRQAG